MKLALYATSLLTAALAAAPAYAVDPPAPNPGVKADARPSVNVNPQADAKVNAEETRRELDRMRAEMRELSKKMAEMSAKLGDVGPREYAYRYIGDPDRGMIGVVLADDENHTRINAITPGGPADKAGLRNDDVIVAVHGAGIDARSNDAAKAALRNLKVGQEVTLNVRRNDKTLEVKVKAERREPFNFVLSIDADQISRDVDRAMHDAHIGSEQALQISEQARAAARQAVEQGRLAADQAHAIAEQARHQAAQARFSTPWWGLNLVSLNPDLGGYFGADRGVLVLSADAETAKTLKSGDVLLAIDGKKVERPEDAMRLLREGEAGREVKVEVLRQRKAQTLSMKAPEFKSLFIPTPPIPPVAPVAPISSPPPLPPTPPAPPTPPTGTI